MQAPFSSSGYDSIAVPDETAPALDSPPTQLSCILCSLIRYLPALLIIFACGTAEAESCRKQVNQLVGGRIFVGFKVESLMCETLKEAINVIPVEHRALLKGLKVTRRAQPNIPETATLAEELKANLVFAVYRPTNGVLELTNSLWKGKSRWMGGLRSEKRAATLLKGLFNANEKRTTSELWLSLINELEIDASQNPRIKRPGHPLVLDRLLLKAQKGLWGSHPSRRDIMIHILGRVILHRLAEGSKWIDLATSWGQLSGWQNPHQGAALEAWPFVVGEAPEVWLRTALGRTPGPKARFLMSPKSGFPSLLAQLSPSLDFAECYRAALTHPSALAERAPEKLMAINALAWWTPRLAGQEHTRFVPMKALQKNAKKLMIEGSKRLLGDGPMSLAAGPIIALATLKAHRDELATVIDQIPSHPPLRWPSDIPQSLRQHLDPSKMQVEIAGKILRPVPARVRIALEQALRRFVGKKSQNKIPKKKVPKLKRLKKRQKRVEAMDLSFEKATELADLAIKMADADRFSEAMKLVAQIPGEFWGHHERLRSLVAIASSYLRSADWTGVSDTLKQCEQLLKGITVKEWRIKYGETIGEIYLLAGRYNDTKRLSSGLGDTPRGKMAKVGLAAKMALALARDGRDLQAMKILRGVLSSVNEIKNPQWKSSVVATIMKCRQQLLKSMAPSSD